MQIYVDFRRVIRLRARLNLTQNSIQVRDSLWREKVVEVLIPQIISHDLRYVVIDAGKARLGGALLSPSVKLMMELDLIHRLILPKAGAVRAEISGACPAHAVTLIPIRAPDVSRVSIGLGTPLAKYSSTARLAPCQA